MWMAVTGIVSGHWTIQAVDNRFVLNDKVDD